MRVEVYYQDISRKFNAINHGLDLNTYCDRLKTLRIYLKEIAEVAYKNKEKVQERYSIDYFKSSTKLNFTHEPYIKKLSQLFGVRTFWKPCLDLDGKVVKGIKAIGIENQIKAFFSVVEYVVTFMDYDRRSYHKAYNVKLMKYRKIQRKWPGKMKIPLNFIDHYSNRSLLIKKNTHLIIDKLLEDIGLTTGLPFYDQVDFYIEEMKLQKPFTTPKFKTNRRIW